MVISIGIFLPGVQIITSDHRRQNMGTFDRRPFGVQVTDIPLTFMLDNDGYVLKLFNDWTNSIVNYDFGNSGEFGTNAEPILTGGPMGPGPVIPEKVPEIIFIFAPEIFTIGMLSAGISL